MRLARKKYFGLVLAALPMYGAVSRINQQTEKLKPMSVEQTQSKGQTPSVGSGELVRLSLPADVCRCFGGGCADKENCQRYLARNERWPELSYIQGGAFVSGVCLYRIEPNT